MLQLHRNLILYKHNIDYRIQLLTTERSERIIKFPIKIGSSPLKEVPVLTPKNLSDDSVKALIERFSSNTDFADALGRLDTGQRIKIITSQTGKALEVYGIAVPEKGEVV